MERKYDQLFMNKNKRRPDTLCLPASICIFQSRPDRLFHIFYAAVGFDFHR